MGIKRIVVGLVTLVVAATTLAAGLSAATPNVYYDMYRDSGAAHQIVAMSSGITPTGTPDVYYDM